MSLQAWRCRRKIDPTGAQNVPLRRLIITFLAIGLIVGAECARAVSSYAYVNNDGTLRIKGQTFRLFGLFIPPSAYTCQRFTLPVTCASQASIALDFKIGSFFVNCNTVVWNPDGTESAYCGVQGEDLGAYLISEGWALALPDAPLEYMMLERVARGRGIGVWASPLSNIYRYPP